MNDATKRNILFIVAVVAALGLIAYFGTGGGVTIPVEVLPSTTVEGEVLSVDPEGGRSTTSPSRYALVKLRDGETVRASLGGCVVFPGQSARLAKYGVGSAAFYIVTADGKNDG